MNAVRRGCGVSIFVDIQKSSGHVPGQWGLGAPASAGGLDKQPPEVPSNLHHSVILWNKRKISECS